MTPLMFLGKVIKVPFFTEMQQLRNMAQVYGLTSTHFGSKCKIMHPSTRGHNGLEFLSDHKACVEPVSKKVHTTNEVICTYL